MIFVVIIILVIAVLLLASGIAIAYIGSNRNGNIEKI